MKITIPVATFVASTLLISISIGLAQGPARTSTPPRPSNGTAVAVIDINFIFKNHLRFKESMDKIKKDIEAFEAYLREERNKITSKTEQLRGLPAGTAGYQDLETEIAGMHTQLSLKTGRKRKEILEREAKVYYNAYQEIEERVALFADQYSIGLVLRFNSEPIDSTKRESVLQGINHAVVFQRNLNITNYILDELNRGGTGPPRVSNRPQIPGGIRGKN